MATVSKWTPFGVALDITATSGTVTRTSATAYTVVLNVAWETYYSGAQTNYGMSATSGGVTKTISAFNGTKRSSGSAQFTGTYSISGNGSASKTITVTFKNFNTDNGDSASKSISLNVSVPAWTSYTIKYNANGGSGAPSSQTKWKNQALTLSSTKPTRTGYTFKNWNTAQGGGGTSYASGASYTANAAATLYAQWTANTYNVTYNANGGSGAPSSQIKTYGVTLTLSSTKPTRTGYNFKGWATTANATTATYASGASYTANAAITLYAVWELAYKKPSISGFSVNRAQGNYKIFFMGTYLLFSFKWASYENITSILLEWASVDGEITGSKTVEASGTSGDVWELVGDGTITTEKTFVVNVTVTDSQSTTITQTVGGVEVPIEAIYESGNYGVSFGKTAELTGYADFTYKAKHRNHVEFENNKCIYGTKPDGTLYEALNLSNANGNTVIGYDNYDNKNGNTNIYGCDINLGVSNISNPGYFRPYRRQGDTITLTLRTAGYVTNSSKDVSFWIPLSCPIIGSPTVTITSINGFTLRQGSKYTHGSSASVSVSPDSYEATITAFNGIYVKAVFSNVTDATNNDAIGIYWNGTITFS